MKKKLKAIISMVTIATIALSSPLSSYALGKNTKVDAVTEGKAVANTKRIIGEYDGKSIYDNEDLAFPKQVPAKYLTHLNVTSIGCNKDGTLMMRDKNANFEDSLGNSLNNSGKSSGGIVNEFKNIRQENQNLKLGFSIGGKYLSGNFIYVAEDEANRKVFAKEVSEVLEYTNFDFINIDWRNVNFSRKPDNVECEYDQGNEHFTGDDWEYYLLMLQEIRNELNELGKKTGKYYEISIVIDTFGETVDAVFNLPNIFDIIDFANFKTYDYWEKWEDVSSLGSELGPNPYSPYIGSLYSVQDILYYCTSQGVPANKIVIEVDNHTIGWEKVSNNGPNQDAMELFADAVKLNMDADGKMSSGAQNEKPIKAGDGGRHFGKWSWKNIDKLIDTYPGLSKKWDDMSKSAYLYSESSGAFFTYDNERSIKEKAKFINKENLGGIVTGMVMNDKVTESGQNDELTKIIYKELFGTAELPKNKLIDDYCDVSTKVAITNGNNEAIASTLKIDITNNMKLISTGSEMTKAAESSLKTVKFPKLYVKTKAGVELKQSNYPLYSITQENGYYVLDIAGTEDKYINPGTTKEITLNLNKVFDGVSNCIEEIYMVQRTNRSAVESCKVQLYSAADDIIKEDVNSDGIVNILDLSTVASKYNLKGTDANFDAKCDINADQFIDLYDLVSIGRCLKN